MKANTSYLGIDTGKHELFLGSPDKFIAKFDNTPGPSGGHRKLIERIRKYQPHHDHTLIAIEATGGYERPIVEALQDAGLPVAIVAPNCVRHYAKSAKVLAKTDKLDSVMIARYAQAHDPRPTPKTPESARKIRALADRRQQIVQDRVREQNRMETCSDPDMIEHLQESIQRLILQEKDLDKRIKAAIQNDEQLQAKAKVLRPVIGVGDQTITSLLANVPELGTLSREQAAALIGLAPHPQDSSTKNGKRRIFGGRAQVRKTLYMAAKTAAQHCPVLKAFYQRLKQQGKPHNVALIAVARKLIVHLNTKMKQHMNQTQTN